MIGLLHDFGKAVLNQHFHEIFERVVNEAKTSGRPLSEVCQEIAGIDHGEVGALVAKNWNLPDQLVESIRLHHNPDKYYGKNKAAHLAHLANALCHKYKIGESGNTIPDKPSKASLKVLGIDNYDFDELWESLDIDPDHFEVLI